MCIFCKIINNELPSYKVYEDTLTLAFLDINPVSDGHVLIIPKLHEQFVENLPDNIHEALFQTMRQLIKPIQKAMNAPSSNIVINNGPNAGQLVNHVHIHIIPRPESGGGRILSIRAQRNPRDKEYFKEIALKIRRKINQ